MTNGHLHPLTLLGRKAVGVFRDLGFDVVDYPEVETEWYNFDGLRMMKDHPARDMQDTFYTTDGRVLRTHCSDAQIRISDERRPPFRVIQFGRVYRNEATDATHEAVFHQLDGIVVDTDITMANLLDTQSRFIEEMFGKKLEYRFVPAFFPFVEPGMEVQFYWKGRWLEMWGSGMVHPGVLENMKINPKKFRGFAFGMGFDRLALMYYGVDDIRVFYNGDLRLISQF